MKKMMMVAAVLMVGLTAGAMAESVPSKNTADMVNVEIEQEANPSLPSDSGLEVILVEDGDTTQAEAYEPEIALCQLELEHLSEIVQQADENGEGSAIEAYFGEVKDEQGNVVVLSDQLATATLAVNEFMPIVVLNYDESYGDVTITFQFKTPYAAGEKVIILIGLLNPETGEIEWMVFEGMGTGDQGAVQMTLSSEVMKAVQENTSLLAVVSAGNMLNL